MFNSIWDGLSALLSFQNFLYMNIGVFLGILFGAMPGVGVMIAIVIFLPVTFGLDPITGIIMLLGIYCGGTYGGSISAILLNTPGTPNSAATIIDGYPLSKKGQAKKALDMALVASVMAGIISAFILLFAAPQLAKVTMYFGPAEYFTLAIFGLSIIASISSGNILKGLIAGCLGLFISIIGIDAASGTARFTFDNLYLLGGIQLAAALIGLFAISEVLKKMIQKKSSPPIKEENVTEGSMDSDDKLRLKDIKRSSGTIFRSSMIGTGVGIIPGTGGGIAAFISHNLAKRKSKNPENYGKGELDGVAAAEAGNNGVTGATLIPLLTLGIPGDAAVAVLLGALMMNGLLPGSSLFTEHSTTIYAVMVGLVFVNLMMLLQGKLLIKLFAKITKIPDQVLVPVLILFCFAGTYTLTSHIFNVYIMLIFGAIAYVLIKFGFSPIPMLLGMILGPLAETNLKRALTISEGSITIFFTRPISVIFIVLTIVAIILAVRGSSNKAETS